MRIIFKKNKKKIWIAYVFVFAFVFVFQNFSITNNSIFFNNAVTAADNPAAATSFDAPSQQISDGTGNALDASQKAKNIDSDKNFAEKAVSAVLSPIFTLMGWILDLGVVILSWTLNSQLMGQGSMMDSPVVRDVWAVFRDFFNMFFILILLFSAFSTIFQVDKYSFKKLWLSILIAVLLINFSFPIARFIIDISNVVMYSFLNGTSGINMNGLSMSVDIMQGSNIENLIMPGGFSKFPVTYEIAAIIFTFILAITFVVLGFLLMIRLFVLMFLIMASPVGFIGSVFPGMSKFSSDWWEALFNYAFFGPIMVLMIMISLKLMNSFGTNSLESQFRSAAGGVGTDGNMITFLASSAQFFIPIIVLWIGMGVSKKMSIVGSGVIVDHAQKFGKWGMTHMSGLSTAKFGVHWADRTLARTAPILSPMAWKAGWKARQGRLDTEALAFSTGKMENFFENVIGRTTSLNPYYGAKRFLRGMNADGLPGAFRESIFNPSDMDRTDRNYESRVNEANKKSKEMESVSDNSDYVIGRLKSAVERGDSLEAHGALMVLAKNNDLNDLMQSDWAKEKLGMDGNFDPDKLVPMLQDIYEKSGSTKKEEIARNLMRLSDIGASNANFGYYKMGHYQYDQSKKKGGFVISSDAEDRAKAAAGKLMNFEPQARQRQLHPDSMFKYDGKGNVLEFSKTGMKLLESFSGDDLAQSDRSRGDLKKRFASAVKQLREGTASNELRQQFDSLGEVGKKYTLMVDYMNSGLDKKNALEKAEKGLKSET